MIEIPLTQGKVALIDDADYDLISQYKWYAVNYQGNFYAERSIWSSGTSKHIKMHRELMDCPVGMVVDHINGNSLDNRRENLRICTQAQNVRNQRLRTDNTSGFKGVAFDKGTSKWRTRIWISGKCIHIGLFDNSLAAHEAYCAASARLHGEYGRIA